MIWACFAASGPRHLGIIEGKMNSQLYQTILQANVRMSVRQPKLYRRWVMQQDNYPKHRSKSTTECLQNNKIRLLQWPSQSPDLNPIEMLWIDLQRAIYVRRPKNMKELKQFCQEEWAKIPPQWCAGLLHSYRKCLVVVTAAILGLHLLFPPPRWMLNVEWVCWKNRFFLSYFRHIMFVNTLDLDEDQITCYDIYSENNEIPKGSHTCSCLHILCNKWFFNVTKA